MLVFHSTPQASWSLLFKDVVDRVGALVLLVLTLPLWLIAALGIRLASKGPVFFCQERAGHYGKGFKMWKFRTMHIDAEARRAELESQNEMSGPVFKIKDDPRIFRFGSWLRKTSIDELPQLINVVRGDISLVGPRALIPQEINQYKRKDIILSVRSGLTGLAQVSGRRDINFDERRRLDIYYVQNWSLLLDIQILFKTVFSVIFRKGAK